MGRGKRQLAGLTEVRAYVAAALALRPMESNAATTSGEERRVAALLPVLTGASSGEVLHLTVRDVDGAGRVLWVRGTYASLLHELAGIEAARIGDRLGHADAGKTARRAYLGTETSPALEVLEGGLSRPRQSGGTVA